MIPAPDALRLQLPALAGSLALHLALAIMLGSWAWRVTAPVTPPVISFAFLPASSPVAVPDIAPLALAEPLVTEPLLARAPTETPVTPAAPEAVVVARKQTATPRQQQRKKTVAAEAAPQSAPATPTVAAPASAIVAPPVFDADYLRNPPPDYPAAARRRRLTGEVILSVLVSAAGSPQSVAVATSSGHDILDTAARAAVLQWRFVPAQSGGAPVPASVLVPINFQLR